MSDEQPQLYSITTILGALGGLLVIVAAFFPLLSTSNPKEQQGVKWLSDYRQELKQLRQSASKEDTPPDVKLALSVVDPSLERLDQFLAQPSGYELWYVLRDAYRFCSIAISYQEPLQLSKEELNLLKIIQQTLTWVLIFLSTIPLLGGYHIVRGVLLRFRKLRTPALCITFFLGLAYTLVASLALFGVPSKERVFLGSAPYILFIGSILLLFCSLFGVSRKTWWRAYGINLLGLGVIFYFLLQALQAIG